MSGDTPRRRRGGFGDEPEPTPRAKRAKRAPIPGTVADMDGRGWFLFDAAATAIFVVTTAAVSLVDTDATNLANLAVSGILFLLSCAAFAYGFILAASRSRDDQLHLAGLYYLTDAAPDAVRKAFMRLWFVQIITATVSVFTVSPPFGVMVAMLGVAVNSAWSARYGRFSPHGTDPGTRASAPGRRHF